MATLTCNCGSVLIRFDTTTPRATVECCCDDCRERLSYCAKLGGPALEHGIFERTRPVTIRYFDNRLSIAKGRDKLKFFKLKPDSGVVNMSTKCCNTFLLKENIKYEGTVIAVIEQDYGNDDNDDLPSEEHQPRPVAHRHNLKNADAQEATLRTFPNDWIPEHVSYLKPLPSIWFDEGGNVVGEPTDTWEATFDAYMEKIMARVPPMMAGLEFGHLMEDQEVEVEVASTKVFTDAHAVGDDAKAAMATAQ